MGNFHGTPIFIEHLRVTASALHRNAKYLQTTAE